MFVLAEQMIELRAIDRETLAQIENPPKRALHLDDALTDRQPRTVQMRFQPGTGRQMIGMGVGFENPLHAQPLAGDDGQQLFSVGRARAPGLGVEIEYRIDQRRPPTGRVEHDIRPGPGLGLVNRTNSGVLCAHCLPQSKKTSDSSYADRRRTQMTERVRPAGPATLSPTPLPSRERGFSGQSPIASGGPAP